MLVGQDDISRSCWQQGRNNKDAMRVFPRGKRRK